MKAEHLSVDMAAAIRAVLQQGMAIREAARQFHVPRTTLQRKTQLVESLGPRALDKILLAGNSAPDAKRHTPLSVEDTTSFVTGPPHSERSPDTDDTDAVDAAAAAPPFVGNAALTRVSDETAVVAEPTVGSSKTTGYTIPGPTVSSMSVLQSPSTCVHSSISSFSRKRSAAVMDASAAVLSDHSQSSSSLPMLPSRPTRPPPLEPAAAPLSNLSKGPRKAINGKIRMLCHSAGSALDELSNAMIMEGKCVYKLGLGQSPFPIPQCIVDELRSNAHQRDYLPVAGLPELRRDIATWASQAFQLPYSKDDVLVGPGTKELLFVLQTVYYGDLLLPNPSCTSYAPQANIAGRNMFWLPTYAEDRWVLRPEVLEDLCSKDPEAPRILILNSPSNPTGCVYNEPDLLAVAEVARKYRMLVVSDEIYSELHHSGDHHSISKFYPEGTIVSGGLSKWCGAGGWRMGFWLFPKSMSWLRTSMLVMASETYTSVASPIQHAARRAFVLDCIELKAYKQKCGKILKIIGQWCHYQLQKMCIDVHPPEGGFYLFPSFARQRKILADRGITTDVELCRRLLHDTGVAILPGSAFGRDPQELFARLAFVDFKGDIALYLIESMDNFELAAIDGFIQSVCPNLDIAMRKLTAWIANPPPRPRASSTSSGTETEVSRAPFKHAVLATVAPPIASAVTLKTIDND